MGALRNSNQEAFYKLFVKSGCPFDSQEVAVFSERMQEVVAHSNLKLNYVPSIPFIKELLLNKKDGLLETFHRLEQAFNCLMQYGVNLMRNQDKPEYKVIKKHTGYYTCNIEDVVQELGDQVLLSMGYQYKNKEYQDEFILHHINEHILIISFELFLTQLYIRHLVEITNTILYNHFSEAIAIQIFDKIDCENFDMKEILDYCQLLQREEQRKTRDPFEHVTAAASGPSSIMELNVDEDDLYGDTFIESNNPLKEMTTHQPSYSPLVASTNERYKQHESKSFPSTGLNFSKESNSFPSSGLKFSNQTIPTERRSEPLSAIDRRIADQYIEGSGRHAERRHTLPDKDRNIYSNPYPDLPPHLTGQSADMRPYAGHPVSNINRGRLDFPGLVGEVPPFTSDRVYGKSNAPTPRIPNIYDN